MALLAKEEDVQKIAVVGAGLMGHGIAQEFALAGYPVGRWWNCADGLPGH